jgi:glycolate oxidase iron-sulfur subunit
MSLSIWKASGAANSTGNTRQRDASVDAAFDGGSRLEACIRCGSCAAVCPTYREAASERLSARGRVSLLAKFRSGEIGHTAAFDGSVFSCILCGACSAVCPRGVEVARDIYGVRSILWKAERKRRFVARGVRLAFMKPGLLCAVLRSLQGVAAYLPLNGVWPFRQLSGMGVSLPKTSLRDGNSFFRVPHARGRVAVMAGCTVNYLYPHIGRALVKVLNALRYEVIVPKGEVCCGAPHMAMGLTEDGERMAEKNLATFRSLNAEAVVSPCPTCVHVIREEYTRRFGQGIAHAVDATQLLGEHDEDLPRLSYDARGGKGERSAAREAAGTNAVFHDPCHALYHLKIREEPRMIIRSLSYALTEPRERGCCGFGGTFRFLNPELSDGMVKRKAAAFAGADLVVTSCPNCVFQLQGTIKDMPVRHLVELVGERIGVGS